MNDIYEVHSNYGSSIFIEEADAISALWLLGSYHDINIDFEIVKKELNNTGFYEHFPLSIIRGK